MSSFYGPLKNWFGYSRRERRATFTILILAVAIIGIRFVLPEKKLEFEVIHNEQLSASADTSNLKKERLSYQGQKAERPRYQNKKLPVNLNTCDSAMLESLPGIGPVLSARIIKYRKLLGGYSSAEQLKEVYGLPAETYELISGRVFADSNGIRKIKINKAEFRELAGFPYFTKYEINAIFKYRKVNGQIKSMRDMTDNKLVPVEKANRIRPYIEFAE